MKSLLAPAALAVALLGACARDRGHDLPSEPLGADGPGAGSDAPVPIDVEHYALELRLDADARRLDGVAAVRFATRAAGRRIVLDLAGLEVRAVRDAAGTELAHERAGDRLLVALGRQLDAGEAAEVRVEYGGTPAKGLFFRGDGAAGYVFTQGQCEDARYWFPCHDVPGDLATSEVRVDVPAAWTTLAAGERVDHRERDGRVVDTWRMHAPHAPYLEVLVAGDLAQLSDADDPRVTWLAPRALASSLPGDLAVTSEALEWLERLSGAPYPFPKYATVCVAGLSVDGMENPSATVLDGAALGALGDDHEDLVVHEAAHQWFGDLVACGAWEDVWLNEGLATYATALFVEERQGREAFHERMDALRERYVAADARAPRAIVHRDYREPQDLFFTGHAYEGGATRLHLLRYVLGDDAFFAGLRRFVGEGAGRTVDTADLRRAFERASGQDLAGFFETFVLSPGHPVLDVGWEWDEQRGRVLVRVHQTHSVDGGAPEVFRGPVDVEVRIAGEVQRERLVLDARRELFELPAKQRPEWVRVDPDRWWPAELHAHRRADEWRLLLRDADGASDRVRAVRALSELAQSAEGPAGDGAQADRALCLADVVDALSGDPSRAVRAEAATALARFADGPQDARRAMRTALARAAREDGEAAVRAAALDALGAFGHDGELAQLGRDLFREEPGPVPAAAARLVARADREGGGAWLAERLTRGDAAPLDPSGEPWRGLLAALSARSADEAAPLVRRALEDRALPEPARVEAVRVALRLLRDRDWLRPALGGMLREDLPRARRAAVEGLAALGDDDALALLVAYAPQCRDPRERRSIERALGLQPAGR